MSTTTTDKYVTIEAPASGKHTVKMSRFLSFAHPVTTEAEARDIIKKYQNDYHDARHVCWAYMLGYDRSRSQNNDNGEPSGTAGRPILGQINSTGLTDVVVVVVRYFGGIQLGTGGLIDAYRTAARMALDEAIKVEKYASTDLQLECPYLNLNSVMGIFKTMNLEVVERVFDNLCTFQIRIRLSQVEQVRQRLSGYGTVTTL